MNKKKKQKKEEETSKEEAFKAVYEYATWGALIHVIKIYIRNFFRFLYDIIHSVIR